MLTGGDSVRVWRVVRDARVLAECYVQREADDADWLLTVYRSNEVFVAEMHSSSDAAVTRAEELYKSLGESEGW